MFYSANEVCTGWERDACLPSAGKLCWRMDPTTNNGSQTGMQGIITGDVRSVCLIESTATSLLDFAGRAIHHKQDMHEE